MSRRTKCTLTELYAKTQQILLKASVVFRYCKTLKKILIIRVDLVAIVPY